MLKNHSIPSSFDDAVGDLHQRGVIEGHEVHREPCAHRLARLGVTEHDALAVGDPVDRALPTRRELHHEQVGAAFRREQLDRFLEPHRDRARALVEELVRAVDRRVEDPEPARPGGEHGLEADRPVRVAELVGGVGDLCRAVHAPELRRRDPDAVEQGIALGLVVRAVDRVRPGHEHRDGEPLAVRGEALEVERRLGQDDVDPLPLDDLAHRVRKARVGTGGNDVERVAEMAPDGALRHVRPDQAQVALAVPAEGAEQRRGSRRARGRDEHGDRSKAHGHVSKQRRSSALREVDAILGELGEAALALGLQHRAHRRAHRRAGVGPDLRVRQQLEPGKAARRGAPRAGSPSATAGSSPSGTSADRSTPPA